MDKSQLMQLQMMEQEANQIEQQLQLIEQHTSDLNSLKIGLDELEKTDKKEILANIGKGIYINAEIKNKELLVEVGDKNLVKKTIPETKKIVESQIAKLTDAKQEMMQRIESLGLEMNEIIRTIDYSQDKSHKHKPEYEKECNCGDDCDCSDEECECEEDCECEK
jgi:prefoldin alpha subunit